MYERKRTADRSAKRRPRSLVLDIKEGLALRRGTDMLVKMEQLVDALSGFGALPVWPAWKEPESEINFSSYGEIFEFDMPKRMYVLSLEELGSGRDIADPAGSICYLKAQDGEEDTHASEALRGALSANETFAGVPAIVLDKPCTAKEIGECLKKLFIGEEDGMAFQNRILSFALESQSLDDFLRKVTEFMRIPFTLYDNSSHLLAHSFDKGSLFDRKLAKDLLGDFVSREFLETLHHMGFLDVMRKQYGVMGVDLPNGMKKIGASIYVKGHYMGMLCGYSLVRMMTDEDIQNLRMICDVVTTLIAKQNPDFYTFGTRKEMLFFSMLTEELEHDSTMNTIEMYEMDLPKDMCLLVIGGAEEHQRTDIPAGFIKVDIAPMVHSCYQIVCDFHVIFLLDAWKDNVFNSDFLGKIKDRLKKYDLYAVVSNIFSDPLEMKSQFDMTKALLRVQAGKEKDKRIIYAHDYIAKTIVNVCKENANMDIYVHPVFRILQKYDEDYGTRYIETLYAYLKAGGNMSQAAKQMKLHYNTMKYRLNNIKSIANIDISQPEIMVNMYISMIAFEE